MGERAQSQTDLVASQACRGRCRVAFLAQLARDAALLVTVRVELANETVNEPGTEGTAHRPGDRHRRVRLQPARALRWRMRWPSRRLSGTSGASWSPAAREPRSAPRGRGRR